MKSLHFTLIACTLCALIGCTSLSQSRNIYRDTEKSVTHRIETSEGIETYKLYFDEARGIHFYKNGQVKGGHLTRDVKIQGITYQQDYIIHFHENGKVGLGTLKHNTTINGITFQRGARIRELSILTQKNIISLSTQQRDLWNYKQIIIFYPNGKVSKGTLAKETKIQGYTLQAHTLVEFDRKGKFKIVDKSPILRGD